MKILPGNDATPEPSNLRVGAQCERAGDPGHVEISSKPSVDAGQSSLPSSASRAAKRQNSEPYWSAPSASAPSTSSAPAVRSTALLFAVPPGPDLARFGRLPEAARDDLQRSFKALEWIHAQVRSGSMPLVKACEVMAARCYNAPGFTGSRLKTKYYAFLKSADWTALVNKALAGPQWWSTTEQIGLSPAFIEFWRSLCERNQRKCKPAHRELRKIWNEHADSRGTYYKSIPGYTEWPVAAPHSNLPRGWEYSNLMRHAPDDHDLAAARVGRFAASQHRRKVFTTRAGLRVGQFFLFDDQVYDHKVIFTSSSGQPGRPMRPRGYDAVDLYSASFIAHLFKPTLLNPDAPASELHLSSRKEFPWFVVDVLLATGFQPEIGTTLVVEHGTASISEELEERLYNATGGKVTVDRSGRFGRAAHAALFEGPSKGNPRFKAALESVFNLVRNNMAMLPGQTGKDWDHSPDELHGRELYDARLVRALPPHLLQQAIRPFMEWTEFVQFATATYAAIDARIDHELEGWGKLVAHEFRYSPAGAWEPIANFQNLSPKLQMALTEEFGRPGGAQMRTRKLSPREVFQAGAAALHKVRNDAVPYLLGSGLGTERTVRNGYIEIHDQELGPDTLRFPTWNKERPLSNGEKVLTYLVRDGLVIADAQNRYLTTLKQQDTPCRADLESVQREMAAARKEEAERMLPQKLRHLPEARAKAAMHRHNANLAAGRPTTAAQAERAAQIRDNVRAADTDDVLIPKPAEEPANPAYQATDEDVNDIL